MEEFAVKVMHRHFEREARTKKKVSRWKNIKKKKAVADEIFSK